MLRCQSYSTSTPWTEKLPVSAWIAQCPACAPTDRYASMNVSRPRFCSFTRSCLIYVYMHTHTQIYIYIYVYIYIYIDALRQLKNLKHQTSQISVSFKHLRLSQVPPPQLQKEFDWSLPKILGTLLVDWRAMFQNSSKLNTYLILPNSNDKIPSNGCQNIIMVILSSLIESLINQIQIKLTPASSGVSRLSLRSQRKKTCALSDCASGLGPKQQQGHGSCCALRHFWYCYSTLYDKFS